MAVAGWLLDRSAAARADDPAIGPELATVAGALYLCPVGQLEQLYSARSAADYDWVQARLPEWLQLIDAPRDLLPRALALQRDLAHHPGMWHRIPISDLLIAEPSCSTALACYTWTATTSGSVPYAPSRPAGWGAASAAGPGAQTPAVLAGTRGGRRSGRVRRIPAWPGDHGVSGRNRPGSARNVTETP